MDSYLYLMVGDDGLIHRHAFIEAPHLLRALSEGERRAEINRDIVGWELWKGGRMLARRGDKHFVRRPR